MAVLATSTLTDSIRNEYVERYLRMAKAASTYDSIEALSRPSALKYSTTNKCPYCTTPYEGREVSCIKCGAPRKEYR